jgi:hypothetical protein
VCGRGIEQAQGEAPAQWSELTALDDKCLAMTFSYGYFHAGRRTRALDHERRA